MASADMISKEHLDELKQNNINKLYRLIRGMKESREILFVLENLGYLPEGFDGDVLVPLLNHSNNKIRLWAVKNLGKVSDPNLLEMLLEIAKDDKDSMV